MSDAEEAGARAVAFSTVLCAVLGALGGAGHALIENLSWSATAGYALIGCVVGVLVLGWFFMLNNLAG
jgi:hypothetical protein